MVKYEEFCFLMIMQFMVWIMRLQWKIHQETGKILSILARLSIRHDIISKDHQDKRLCCILPRYSSLLSYGNHSKWNNNKHWTSLIISENAKEVKTVIVVKSPRHLSLQHCNVTHWLFMSTTCIMKFLPVVRFFMYTRDSFFAESHPYVTVLSYVKM